MKRLWVIWVAILVGGLVVALAGVYYLIGLGNRQTAPAEKTGGQSGLWFGYEVEAVSYTDKYLVENDLLWPKYDRQKVDEFVAQYKGELIVKVSVEEIKVSRERGAEAVLNYLGDISGSSQVGIQSIAMVEIESAFQNRVGTGEKDGLAQILSDLESNEVILREMIVPIEVADLQVRIIGATASLRANLGLMRDMELDYIGGIVAASNVEELTVEWQDISFEIEGLREKYRVF